MRIKRKTPRKVRNELISAFFVAFATPNNVISPILRYQPVANIESLLLDRTNTDGTHISGCTIIVNGTPVTLS